MSPDNDDDDDNDGLQRRKEKEEGEKKRKKENLASLNVRDPFLERTAMARSPWTPLEFWFHSGTHTLCLSKKTGLFVFFRQSISAIRSSAALTGADLSGSARCFSFVSRRNWAASSAVRALSGASALLMRVIFFDWIRSQNPAPRCLPLNLDRTFWRKLLKRSDSSF